MLRSWVNMLYLENSAFRAGSHFSCHVPHGLALLADSSLATLLIDFGSAATHDRLLTGYHSLNTFGVKCAI